MSGLFKKIWSYVLRHKKSALIGLLISLLGILISVCLSVYYGNKSASKEDLKNTENRIISELTAPPGELREEMAKANREANESYKLGLSKMDKGNYKGAVADFNMSVSFVNTPSAHLALGNALAQEGKYEDAAIHFEIAFAEAVNEKTKKSAIENLAFIEANKNHQVGKWQPIKITKESPPLISRSVSPPDQVIVLFPVRSDGSFKIKAGDVYNVVVLKP